ncbi:MFS transporter [Stackebrandtia albiflava]|uniref:MFS transporter n=1 Tax=Stackebrandtia albiflava TaxID=406432 RepID=A0A562V2Y2_9ACTN|nr:MFS transporter [Stackebrandtia albiflava]TWJ12203.1 MFS transporter [Stackebrandtia albiflava]
MSERISVRGDRDFRILWAGRAAGQLAAAMSGVVVQVLAVTALGADLSDVALLAAVTAAVTAVLALPTGLFVEYRRKRPVMLAAELIRAAGFGGVLLAGWLGGLRFELLVLAAAVVAVGQVGYLAASSPHLAALVSRRRLVDATGRLESTVWLSVTIGPAVAGALVAWTGPVAAVAALVVGFAVSAGTVMLLRTPEPEPAVPEPGGSRSSELLAGLRYVRHHPELRRILAGWLLFAGASGMAAPLTTVFYLRELQFSSVEYGLLMGVPSLGGLLGARLAGPLASRWGAVRVARWAGLARSPWWLLTASVVPGPAAAWLTGGAFALLLVFAALTNSVLAAYRQIVTPDHLLSRVATLWSFTTTASQPVFIVVGGVLAELVGVRASLCVVAGLVLLSGMLLPSGSPPASRPAAG